MFTRPYEYGLKYGKKQRTRLPYFANAIDNNIVWVLINPKDGHITGQYGRGPIPYTLIPKTIAPGVFPLRQGMIPQTGLMRQIIDNLTELSTLSLSQLKDEIDSNKTWDYLYKNITDDMRKPSEKKFLRGYIYGERIHGYMTPSGIFVLLEPGWIEGWRGITNSYDIHLGPYIRIKFPSGQILRAPLRGNPALDSNSDFHMPKIIEKALYLTKT